MFPAPLTRRGFGTVLMAVVAPLPTACVTTPSATGASPAPPEGQGSVVLRVSVEGLKFLNNHTLHARPAGGGPTVDFVGWSAGSDGYWRQYYDESEKGQLVVSSLPPGDHEFFGFSVMTGAWGGLRTIRPLTPFSVPFSVGAGETVYLGSLSARFLTAGAAAAGRQGQVQIDPQRRTGFVLLTADSSARDLPELARRSPPLTAERLTVRLLR